MDAADMASQIETAKYDPARRQNPYAAERALFYATSWGSADLALKQVESGDDYPDAFMRAVCDELRQIRFIENKAALAAAPMERAA